jgi:hypothetical protein
MAPRAGNASRGTNAVALDEAGLSEALEFRLLDAGVQVRALFYMDKRDVSAAQISSRRAARLYGLIGARCTPAMSSTSSARREAPRTDLSLAWRRCARGRSGERLCQPA